MALIKTHQLDIITLLETHLDEECNCSFLHRLGKAWSGNFVSVVGRSGGILVAQKSSSIKATTISKNTQSLNLVMETPCMSPQIFSAIYASTSVHTRRSLWTLLSALGSVSLSQFLYNDFSTILFIDEKLGGRPFLLSSSVLDFQNFVFNSGLLDFGFYGSRFTWSNKALQDLCQVGLCPW